MPSYDENAGNQAIQPRSAYGEAGAKMKGSYIASRDVGSAA